MQGDHVDRHGSLDSLVDRGQKKCLRAAAGFAGGAERVTPHVRQRLEKVERTDAVPQLKPGEAQPPQVLAASSECVRKLLAVRVADHVVAEDDDALAREANRATWA